MPWIEDEHNWQRLCPGRTGFLIEETPDKQVNQVILIQIGVNPCSFTLHIWLISYLISLRSDHLHVFLSWVSTLLGLQMSKPVLSPRLEVLHRPVPDSCSSFCFDLSCHLLLLCVVITGHPHITMSCFCGHSWTLNALMRASVSDLSLYLQGLAWSFVKGWSMCLLPE